MRPLRLDMVGFAAFRDATVVDFTDADFFALVGPTGSGKSTVLDAICFALYGTAPRWADRRAIANALAPSAGEARVRLVFESAGARFVATRVVRRDTKGRVTTTHAGLEQLPPGFDLAAMTSGDGQLGDVLAGTPAEMESAVQDAVGLPFDQFTSCVLLPQGQFAEFLHAKPAVRQQILVNLLGLHVYEKVRERAGVLATQAEAQLTATDRLVAELADASDEALAETKATWDRMVTLADGVERAVPVLGAAEAGLGTARERLTTLDADLRALAAVAPPPGVADVAGAVAAARAAHRAAMAVVTQAEEREEKLRGEMAAAGDANDLRRLLDLHSERARLQERADAATEAVTTAEAEYTKSGKAVAAATTAAETAQAAVADAEAEVEAARTADRAATLRPHLVAGAPCPVCEQVVTTVPDGTDAPRLAAANAALAAAKVFAKDAAHRSATQDRAHRDLEVALAGARGQLSQIRTRAEELDTQLAGAPSVPALREELQALNELQMRVDEAATEVRAARDASRKAGAEAARADERITAQWRSFDSVRDGVARFGPPPADRDDLAAAWTALTGWAGTSAQELARDRDSAVTAVTHAERAVADARTAIEELFTAAGRPAVVADAARAAAVAVEQARSAYERIADRRAQADKLRAARAEHEHDLQVAKALALHLRANNFERWLLAEALDSLVDGASAILREVSGGQYDLGHDKGEFFVVDHHDAGLRRPVRTLSGGETFQASLALALALADQLAGLSTSAASLESIMLDEGFGTLDAATLDTVAATLENLAARGDRMVGVVTHVAALAERVPVRYDVRKDTRTSYVDRVG